MFFFFLLNKLHVLKDGSVTNSYLAYCVGSEFCVTHISGRIKLNHFQTVAASQTRKTNLLIDPIINTLRRIEIAD